MMARRFDDGFKTCILDSYFCKNELKCSTKIKAQNKHLKTLGVIEGNCDLSPNFVFALTVYDYKMFTN